MRSKNFNPFFINSNMYIKQYDNNSLEEFFISVGGNIGNAYATHCLLKQLNVDLNKDNHIQNIYRYDFLKQDKDIDYINNNCSHVIFILQDHIRLELLKDYWQVSPYINVINFIKRIKKPIIIMGLGANCFEGYKKDFHKELDKELILFLKELSNYSEIFGIRGYYTQEVLSNLGINNINVIGCHSFYENGIDKNIVKHEYYDSLKVVLSNPVPSDLNNRYPIILQDLYHPLDFENSKLFFNIEDWKNFVSSFDFMFGPRAHGSIVALNCGVPACIINPDSRAREMSEFFKIPYFPELSNEENIEKIYSLCDYTELNKQYPILYNNYIEFLNRYILN